MQNKKILVGLVLVFAFLSGYALIDSTNLFTQLANQPGQNAIQPGQNIQPGQSDGKNYPTCPSGQNYCYSKDACINPDEACPTKHNCPEGTYYCSANAQCLAEDVNCIYPGTYPENCSEGQYWCPEKNACIGNNEPCEDPRGCGDGYWCPSKQACIGANETCEDPKQNYCPQGQNWCYETNRCQGPEEPCVPNYNQCRQDQYWCDFKNSCIGNNEACYDSGCGFDQYWCDGKDRCVDKNESCPYKLVCPAQSRACGDPFDNNSYCVADGAYCQFDEPLIVDPPDNTCYYNCDGQEYQYACDENQPMCISEVQREIKNRMRNIQDMQREYSNRQRDKKNLMKEVMFVTEKGIDISKSNCSAELERLAQVETNVQEMIKQYETELRALETKTKVTWDDFEKIEEINRSYWDTLNWEMDMRDAWDYCGNLKHGYEVRRDAEKGLKYDCRDLSREADRVVKEAARLGVEEDSIKDIGNETATIKNSCSSCFQKVLDILDSGGDAQDAQFQKDDCFFQMPTLWDNVNQMFRKFDDIRTCQDLDFIINDMERGYEDGKNMVNECASDGKNVTKLNEILSKIDQTFVQIKNKRTAAECEEGRWIAHGLEEQRGRFEEIFERTCGGFERDTQYIEDIFNNIDVNEYIDYNLDAIEDRFENMMSEMERQVMSRVTNLVSNFQTQMITMLDRLNKVVEKTGEGVQKNFEDQLEFITVLENDEKGKELQSKFLNDQNTVLTLIEENVENIDQLKKNRVFAADIEAITKIIEENTIVGKEAKDLVESIYSELENLPNLSEEEQQEKIQTLKDQAANAREVSINYMLENEIMLQPDCTPNDWFGADCTFVSREGHIQGKEDEKGNIIGLVPSDSLQRQEFALMLGRLLDIDEAGEPQNTTLSTWAAGNWAAIEQRKWRITNSNVDASAPIIRGEVACMIVDALGLEESENPEQVFADVPVDNEYAGCFEAVFHEGIILGQGGSSEGSLPNATPYSNLNRAESTAVMARTSNSYENLQ